MNHTKEVERKLAKLAALEAGGVENWVWYNESLVDWFKENKIDQAKLAFIEQLDDILAGCNVSEPAGRGCGYCIDYDESDERDIGKLLDQYVKQIQDI